MPAKPLTHGVRCLGASGVVAFGRASASACISRGSGAAATAPLSSNVSQAMRWAGRMVIALSRPVVARDRSSGGRPVVAAAVAARSSRRDSAARTAGQRHGPADELALAGRGGEEQRRGAEVVAVGKIEQQVEPSVTVDVAGPEQARRRVRAQHALAGSDARTLELGEHLALAAARETEPAALARAVAAH